MGPEEFPPQLPWVSQRDALAWDLMLMELASGATSVLAANSIAPSWSSDGCETAWSPDYSFVYHVKERSGNKRNSIRRYDPSIGRSSLWLDVPGEWSHEYFPRLSWDGAYLVFGASTGGHEHDSADYEIFLSKTGAPAGEVTRLTFHSGNDTWPDLWLED